MKTWQHDETGRMTESESSPGRRWFEVRNFKHCQNGGEVCYAGSQDGICCPDDSCDIDDGIRGTVSQVTETFQNVTEAIL